MPIDPNTILFEQIPDGETTTELPPVAGSMTVPVRSIGYQETLQALGAAGLTRITLRHVQQGQEAEDPDWAGGIARVPVRQAYSFGIGVLEPATGGATIDATHAGYESADFGRVRIAVRGTGISYREEDVAEPPATLDTLIYVESGMALDDGLTSRVLSVINERVRIATRSRSESDAASAVAAALSFEDATAIVYRILVASTLELSGEIDGRSIAVVIEALQLAGAVSSWNEGRAAVIASLAIETLADMRAKELLADGLELSGAIADVLTATAALVDTLLAADVVDGGARIAVAITDAMNIDATAASSSEAFALIRDGAAFVLHLGLSDGQYVATAMNTVTKGQSTYTNYPFNSFGRLGNTYYGMSPDGIRRLEGADDDGDPIAARVRLAFTNMGSLAQKRIRAAYLAYTSTGEIRVKCIVAGADGRKEAHCYRLEAQPADVPTVGRVKIGEGIKTAYFGWELESIDGSAFALDVLEIVPIIIDQKMPGQNGGKR